MKDKKYDIGIFIFRRDLRIEDNRGLIKLSEECEEIMPIFIFDPYQTEKNNKSKNYISFRVLRFICESLKNLNEEIEKKNSKLYIFYGKPSTVLTYLINILKNNKKYKNKNICVGFNEDYTKYSIERDNDIKNKLTHLQIDYLINDDDYTLCAMDLLIKENGEAYKQFGAFKKNMISKEKEFNKTNYKKIEFMKEKIKIDKTLKINEIDVFWNEDIETNYNPIEKGGRDEGKKILHKLNNFKDYNTKRDILSYETTRLSAHLNFGTISEREFYEQLKKSLGKKTLLINQIIWRDYYLSLNKYLKNCNSYDSHVDERYNKLKWLDYYDGKNTLFKTKKHEKSYQEWELMMNSKTGFLLIDAALEEIKQTGYMHNRCRLLVGSFSVKYLQINPLCRFVGLNDWFSRYLVDCITSQNKLNCQWITEFDYSGKKFSPSSSVIAGRPMNVSNLMIKKWDPECLYIKKWLPHLKNMDNKILINWDTKYDENIHPKPLFDAKQRYIEWIELCKNKK